MRASRARRRCDRHAAQRARRGRACAQLARRAYGARIVLGTRLAVLASMPTLALIVVDEEHGRAQAAGRVALFGARSCRMAGEAARHHGRARLGDAVAESWWQAEQGRYTRLHAVAPRGGRRDAADRAADRSRRGAAARARVDGRAVRAARRGAEGAARARRTEPRVPEPARLCAAARAMPAAGRRLPARSAYVAAQARARVALPSLRLGIAHSAVVPRVREPTSRARARHATHRGGARRGRARARVLRIDATARAARAAHRRSFPMCTRVRSTSSSARR